MKEIDPQNKEFTEFIYTITAEVQFFNNDAISEPYGWISIHQDNIATTLWTQHEYENEEPRLSKVTASADIVAFDTPNQLCFSGDVQEYNRNGANVLAYPTKQISGTANQIIKLPGQDQNNYVQLKYQVKLKYDYTKSPTIINLKNSDFERR
ncbi:hypothetical protein [Bacillus cereus]|uniref:hypothetical protein n=1 Tax=Bacillus cereus TaxID=1396 RepID=UPI000C283A29|nr:hypothetical protein [Bacillus cereus]